MNKLITKLLVGFLFMLSTVEVNAQVTVAGSAGAANGVYATLKLAFDALNLETTQAGNNITVSITASTVEVASAILNQPSVSSWASLTIAPTGGAARTISGAITGNLIDLNGADNVTIDGLNTGSNSLTISNTATGASNTVRFINDASNNIIQNCTLQGSASTASNGVVFFSTGLTTGNDGNNINNCNVTAAGINLPINGIFSLGTNSAVDNSSNTINANNISDYFITTGSASIGILLAATGNSAWTITNNKLFQTANRIYTSSQAGLCGISILTGSGYSITGNIIGFANSAGTGTTNMIGNSVALTGTFPSAYTTTGAPNATRYIAINCSFSANGTVSSIQNNTIAGFALYTSSGAGTTNGIFCGININSGNVNIGTVTGNNIGATTGNGSIYTACTTTGGAAVGIYVTSTNAVSIRNNTIGAIDAMGTTAAVSGGFTGINVAGAISSYDVSGNTIGNSTNPNLRMGNLTTGANLSNVGVTFGIATGTAQFNGILNQVTIPVAGTIGTIALPNIIRNGSLNSSSTTTSIRGITSSGSPIISNNVINNLTTQSTNSALASTLLAGMGIFLNGNNAGTIVRNNTINSLSLANTTTIGTNIAAIASFGASADIYGNKIYDINNASTSVSATAPGTSSALFFRQPTGIFNFYNNMVSLGNGQTTNTAFNGVWEQQSGATVYTLNAYFNSINIEGTVTAGAQPSFCFNRGSYTASVVTQTVSILNNIFTNTRSGGTGKHYTLGNCIGAVADATGWPANASDYNVLNANAATVGFWTVDQTFAGWKAASSSDAHSYSGIAVTYIASATGDLHLNMGASATVLESHGVTGTGITTDYDAQVRPGGGGVSNGGGFAPDLGADEFDGTYIDDLGPTISYTLLANTTSTANRTTSSFAVITDAASVNTTAGTRPRIYYKLSTDVNNTFNDNTPGTVGWKFVEANGAGGSPFDFTIDYSLLFGSPVIATGDIIQYFVVAQDLAGTPNVGINSGTFTVAPASVALTGAAFPINGTINQYFISAGISGIVTVPGTYPTLTGAGGLFAAINAGVITGNVTVNITANLTEDGSNALNQWSEEPAASNFTLTINPDAAVVRIITGSVPAGMIRFNGADRVTVDGRFGGSGKFLSFINTDGTFAGSCFNFLNGATNNTLKYSLMQAVTISAGSVLFNTTTGAGNSNNTIDNCRITAFDGVTTGNVCISSTGTIGNENINNTISNNELIDFGSRAIDLAATGTTAWSIMNNSLYHPGGGVSFAGAGSVLGLRIQGGGNYTITGNFIGGSAALATGANPVFSSTTALVTYVGISAILTTGTTNIKANVIRGTTINCVPVAAVGSVYAGITASGLGAANIGGAVAGEGNTIGSNTINSSIVFTTTTAAATSTTQLNGINSSGTGNLIRGNTIGGYDINNLGAAPAATTFFGIVSTGYTAVPPMLITENVVGSNGAGAAANSIRFLATSISTAPGIIGITAQGTAVATNITNNFIKNISNQSITSSGNFSGLLVLSPISFPVAVTGNTIDNINSVANINGTAYTAISSSVINSTINIGNNTITNITQASSATGATVRGILHSGSSVATIAINTITNLNTSGSFGTTPTGAVTGAQGVLLTSGASLASISQNTISGIANSNTGAFATSASAIGVNNATSATITRNTISDIINTSTGTTVTTPPTASGIICAVPASNININNNFIALGNAQTTNTTFNGLWVVASGGYTVNAHYNSISISGAAASGALPSFGLLRGDNSGTAVTSNMNLRDNIFGNARIGGTGKHYAIANQSTVPSATGWPSTASNYNDLAAVAPATVGLWGATDQAFGAWQASSAGDANSVTVAPVFVSPSDLHLVPASNPALNNVGTPVAGITQDIDNQTRDIANPDMGADEFGGVAYVWTGATNTNWSLAGNWLPVAVPNGFDNATIPVVANLPALTASVPINDIDIAATAFANIAGQTFTINGAVTGAGALSGSATSSLTLNGTAGTLNFTGGSNSLNNLSLGVTTVATLGSALDIYGVLGFTAGSNLNMNTQAVTLKSTATATARVANLTGSTLTGATNVTVERYIPNPQRAWHLLSAKAVTGSQTIFNSWQESGAVVTQKGTWMTSGASLLPGFDGTSANGSSILIHDQTVPSWTTIPVANTNATALSSRQGYMVFVRGDRNCTPANATVTPTVLKANGNLTQGTLAAVTVSSTGSGRTLVGNPYASPIDMETIFTGTANLDQNMMVWDPALAGNNNVGGFRSVVRTGVNTYTQTPVVLGGTLSDPTVRFIHSGSAFFLKATGANANVVFSESVKTASTTAVYNPIVATADQQIIANLMTVQSDNKAQLTDGIRVRYDASYSASQTDDIEKMGNFGENISSYRNGKKLIVEQRPMIVSTDTIYLRMTNTGIKDYRFQIGTIDFVQADVTAYLEDLYKGSRKEIDLSGAINYVDFNITSDAASANQDRFRIVFAAKGPQPQTITTIKAAQQGTAIAVEWKASNQYNMKQYEVEKSTDGINYNKVNTQSSVGINGSDATYNWMDVNPVIGNNHYRVRSVGMTGAVKISQSVTVFMGKGNASITVYPNPVINRNIGLLFSDMEKGIYQLRLMNVSGQVVYTRTVNHTGGSATQSLPLGYGIAKGSYQLEITKPDHSKTTKAIIITE